jgi:hypothetical protein
MQNARLITETREALEQQTATADVLGVINSSPGDLAPVFDAILDKAHSLCDAPCGSLQIHDGERFHAIATRGMPETFVAMLRRGYRSKLGARGDAVQISDMAEMAAGSPGDAVAQATVNVAGLRTVLFVPLRKGAGQGRAPDRGYQAGLRLYEGALPRAQEERSSPRRDLCPGQSIHGSTTIIAFTDGIMRSLCEKGRSDGSMRRHNSAAILPFCCSMSTSHASDLHADALFRPSLNRREHRNRIDASIGRGGFNPDRLA